MREQPAAETRFLIIGFGNTLRRDDGVGPKIADAFSGLNLPGVVCLSCPLLTPELAEPLARAANVVFVDAAVDAPCEVRLRKLAPAPSSQIMAHAAQPATLLALARDLFGHAPEGWLLTVPAADLGIGEELSPLARQGMEAGLSQLRALLAGPVGD